MNSGVARSVVAMLVVLWLSAAYAMGRQTVATSGEGNAVPAAPPPRLSDTGLFDRGRPGAVHDRNRPFSPQYPLWSDGAFKRRWVYLPPGSAIDATDMNDWEFPVGTRLWKEFRFGGRKIETRFLWKAAPGKWLAGVYAWNDEQTEGLLAPEEGLAGVLELAPGRWHSIPSRLDCAACHGSSNEPLGFNALQLSTDRDPNAIHGEPLGPAMVTLKTLVEERLLGPAGPELLADPPRIRTESPRTRAVLGYLASNCGACHNRRGEIAANLPPLAHGDVMAAGDAVARSLIGLSTSWQVPGAPVGATVAIDPAHPEWSAILARLRSRRPSSQMPPLGTVLPDHEAIDAVAEWIATDLARRVTSP